MWRAVIILVLFAPSVVSAQVVITEIMYDLEGSDSGREWIEITNTGQTDVSIAGWKFFESGVNHTFTVVLGNETLSAGESAVIADSASKFQADWPSFSETLFDSSFSLKNTGEELVIKNEGLVTEDSVSYVPEWGAGGDGNSLQLIGGVWKASAPTPGSGSSGVEDATTPTTPSENIVQPASPGPPRVEIRPSLFVDAGGDRFVVAGADTEFSANVFNDAGVFLEGITLFWNFGNGEVAEGNNTLHHYDFPGSYRVIVSASSGKDTAVDSMIIVAEPPSVFVSGEDSASVELTNKGSREIDLSLWFLQSGKDFFQFPEETYILPNTAIRFSRSSMRIGSEQTRLLYPNGTPVALKAQKETETKVITSAPQIQTITPPRSTPVANKAVKIPTTLNEASPENTIQASQVATPVEASREASLFVWLLAFVGVIGMGAMGVVLIQMQKKDHIQEEADLYEIIEEE